MWQCHTYPWVSVAVPSGARHVPSVVFGKDEHDPGVNGNAPRAPAAVLVGAKRTAMRVTGPGSTMTVSFQPCSSGLAGVALPCRNGVTSGLPPIAPPTATL